MSLKVTEIVAKWHVEGLWAALPMAAWAISALKKWCQKGTDDQPMPGRGFLVIVWIGRHLKQE